MRLAHADNSSEACYTNQLSVCHICLMVVITENRELNYLGILLDW